MKPKALYVLIIALFLVLGTAVTLALIFTGQPKDYVEGSASIFCVGLTLWALFGHIFVED